MGLTKTAVSYTFVEPSSPLHPQPISTQYAPPTPGRSFSRPCLLHATELELWWCRKPLPLVVASVLSNGGSSLGRHHRVWNKTKHGAFRTLPDIFFMNIEYIQRNTWGLEMWPSRVSRREYLPSMGKILGSVSNTTNKQVIHVNCAVQ